MVTGEVRPQARKPVEKQLETAPENQLLANNQSLQAGSRNETATRHHENLLNRKNTPNHYPYRKNSAKKAGLLEQRFEPTLQV